MKFLFFFLATLTLLPAQQREAAMPPRQPVPPAVMQEARKAVDGLIAQVLKGNNQAALQLMHPGWKKKLALKAGGMKALDAAFAEALKNQQAQGLKVLMMESAAPTVAFEVDFGNLADGTQGYKQLMVFVPTRKVISVFDRGVDPPKAHKALSETFTAAVRDKTGGPWTFIDGANLRPVDLRELFPFLPRDDEALGLPKPGGRFIE